jgi:hypothetical protein
MRRTTSRSPSFKLDSAYRTEIESWAIRKCNIVKAILKNKVADLRFPAPAPAGLANPAEERRPGFGNPGSERLREQKCKINIENR